MRQTKSSLKSQQRQRTRRRLLDAALSLFASQGYEATSVGDICERTALSKGAFYFHFPGKEALLVEAVEGATERGSGDLDFRPVRSADSSGPSAGLRRSGHQGASISPALQLELWAQALRQEQVWHHLRISRTRFAAALRRRLRRRLGAEGAADVEALTRGLVILRDGLILQSLRFPRDPMAGRLDALVAALIRHALGEEPFAPSWGEEPEKRPA
jgi:AcrR family transcriptional regulator